jgi:DNA-binding NarL/FixJ family response regulator
LKMNQLILADNQTIFRAGVARVLTREAEMTIVAQCDDSTRLATALEGYPTAILMVASSLGLNVPALLTRTRSQGNRVVLVAENQEEVAAELVAQLDGVVCRNITSVSLVECIRGVSLGKRFIQRASITTMQAPDSVGTRVRDRLTPKEMQIVALIVQGCKNKDIASQLGTKEQVIKNYLRSIYDKTGVSDRLELALFTLHHRVLAEAAEKVGNLLQMRSA